MKYGNIKPIVDTLQYIFEWMINSGCVPKLFNISILKPLIKDSTKGSEDVNNLRPLSISDVYTNIYEKIILNLIKIEHNDHSKQFGFKTNSSCSHASFILNEIIRLNKNNKKPTYIVSIDASKAFDRVSRTKLWLEMFEMKISGTIIIALKNYYENFYILVVNKKNYSTPFITTFGVKQGGCCSSELYKLYCEKLANLVTKLELGIKIGNTIINILMYADDILITAQSIDECQKILNEISNYSQTHQVKFNPTKTNVLAFNTNENINLILCGEPIVRSSKIKYLGCIFEDNYSNKAHLERRKTAVFCGIAAQKC